MRETFNQIRTKFWITKPRNYIGPIIKKCVTCNRHEGSPFQYLTPPDLPSYRLSDKFSFTYSAVNYAGPLYINSIYGKLQTSKCWIVLFTCVSTRCLYLGLVSDCASSSNVRVLKRFFAARGVPILIISDNGSQFISNEIQSFVDSRGTKWQFNLPSAPWWGGMFEWMIRSMKSCLKKLLGWSRVDYEQLQMLLTEIQTVINNKPFTFLYEERTKKVLTPNHLLLGRKTNLENISKSINFIYEELNKRSQHLHKLLEHFRNGWRTEYFTEFREKLKTVK